MDRIPCATREIAAVLHDRGVSRVVVVGLPGSGKSTLARSISSALDLNFIEADSLFWKPDGRHLNEGELRSAVEARLQSLERWVFEGHFKSCHSVVLPRAQAVVVIDKGFASSFASYAARELLRSDTSWRTKLSKLLFVPLNFGRIRRVREEALAGYSGPVFQLSG